MILPNKQAHQQNKLSPHVKAIGVFREIQDQQRKQVLSKRLTCGFTVEALFTNIVKHWLCLLGRYNIDNKLAHKQRLFFVPSLELGHLYKVKLTMEIRN